MQDPLETAADSSNGSTGTPAHVTAQVVVNTTHSGQHTLVDSDAASTSAGTIVSGSPHFITVTGVFQAQTVPRNCYFIYLLAVKLRGVKSEIGLNDTCIHAFEKKLH